MTDMRVHSVWVLAKLDPDTFAHQTTLGTMLTTPHLGGAVAFATPEQAEAVRAKHAPKFDGMFPFPVDARLFADSHYRPDDDNGGSQGDSAKHNPPRGNA